jgi:hypothetical protein
MASLQNQITPEILMSIVKVIALIVVAAFMAAFFLTVDVSAGPAPKAGEQARVFAMCLGSHPKAEKPPAALHFFIEQVAKKPANMQRYRAFMMAPTHQCLDRRLLNRPPVKAHLISMHSTFTLPNGKCLQVWKVLLVNPPIPDHVAWSWFVCGGAAEPTRKGTDV